MGNYDEFAQEYETMTGEMELGMREHFRSLLPPLSGLSLLDVGCGSGLDASWYASRGARVCGVDVSREEIAMAHARGCGEFRVADMAALPYASGSFDVVTSLYALQASPDVPAAMREMVRVARPGGTLLILTKHPVRNLLEGHVNDGASDYYARRNVTSYIFNRSIRLTEPGHALQEYLRPSVLREARLGLFEEHTDFPASDQVIAGMTYPTYMILGFRKDLPERSWWHLFCSRFKYGKSR